MKKKRHGQDFIEMGKQLVGKEIFAKILATPQSDNDDDDLDDEDDDELTEEQIKLMKKMLGKFKK